MKKLYDRIIEKKTYFKKSEGIYNLPDVGNPINNREFSGGVKKIKEYYELKSIPEYSSHEKKDTALLAVIQLIIRLLNQR